LTRGRKKARRAEKSQKVDGGQFWGGDCPEGGEAAEKPGGDKTSREIGVAANKMSSEVHKNQNVQTRSGQPPLEV